MPRPENKIELLEQSRRNFEKLMGYIMSIPNPNIEFPQGTMNRNVRDVLAHIYHWQILMKKWYKEGMSGNNPQMPHEGYTWKTTPALNKKIWETYQTINLEEIKNKLILSHTDTLTMIEKHSDDELYQKKRYQWTGTTSLASIFISATSSHYDWALKLIRKALKRLKQ